MVILIDIGNTNIVIGEYENEIGNIYRFQTDKSKSADEYYIYLKDILKNATGIIISSVVPELNKTFKDLTIKYLNIEPLFVGAGIKTGVKIIADNPKEVGADLVAGASGAISNYSENAIVVDMGTATTFTLILNKTIKGIVITTGLIKQKNALIGGASQLTQFEFKTPKKILGTNTIDCLNSGLLYGHTFMIEKIVEEIKNQSDIKDINVIITGGASAELKDLFTEKFIFDDLLLLKGLVNIYNKNT